MQRSNCVGQWQPYSAPQVTLTSFKSPESHCEPITSPRWLERINLKNESPCWRRQGHILAELAVVCNKETFLLSAFLASSCIQGQIPSFEPRHRRYAALWTRILLQISHIRGSQTATMNRRQSTGPNKHLADVAKAQVRALLCSRCSASSHHA